jgi:hypothetical protein
MRIQISEAEFAGMFREFRSSAWRLETLSRYAMDYEAADYQRFLDGGHPDVSESGWFRPWLDMISEVTRQGREIVRVRILTEPPSDYQRFEMWCAQWNTAAGERIGYLTQSRARELGLPVDLGDWWLYDDARLVLMRFDEAGRITSKELVTDPILVAQHCEWRDLAVRYATPAGKTAAA